MSYASEIAALVVRVDWEWCGLGLYRPHVIRRPPESWLQDDFGNLVRLPWRSYFSATYAVAGLVDYRNGAPLFSDLANGH